MNTLLQWFVTSSVLILAVLALRRLLGGRISPRVKYSGRADPGAYLSHSDHHPPAPRHLLHGGGVNRPGPQPDL